MNIRLFKPSLGQEELNNIKEAFERAWIGLGPNVTQFEEEWKRHLDVKAALAVNSATAALHLAVAAYKFPAGKKVLVPTITFASTAFAAIYNRLEPVFVDVDEKTVSMSITDMEKKYDKDCVAIIPVHFGGHPAKMEDICAFAKAKNMKVIEDCAHTSGVNYRGRNLGTWGDMGCFSFEEKKLMTTGDGGMLVSDDVSLIEEIKPTRWIGIDKDTWRRSANYNEQGVTDNKHWYYEIAMLGYKYNMNDLAAAIGLAQLKKLPLMNRRKQEIIDYYLKGIANIENIEPLLPYETDKYVYHLFGIRNKDRDTLISHLKKNGIATGMHYVPLTNFPFFKKYKSFTPIADKIWKDFITLPLHADLTNKEIAYVIDNLKQ